MKGVKEKFFVITAFLFIANVFILSQAFRLQVLDIFGKGKELRRIVIPCKRGFIYDRHGESLAITTQVPSLYACPDAIKRPKEVAKILARILRIKYRVLLNCLKRRGEFIWIKRWLTPQEADEIEKMDLDGLNFRPENKRSYPHNSLAGQVLGFVGIDGLGLEGLEKRYDHVLQGTPGFYYGIRDARGKIILAPRAPIQPAQDGDALYLSIDVGIQYAAEQALKKAVSKWHAKKGCAIVVVPQTGEILAMANYPFFNPNRFRYATPSLWRNHAITDSFEPGSTFKTFLLAAALEEKIWRPHDILYAENGHFHFEDVTFHDVKPHGWLSVENVIVYSSNIGAVKMGLKVGAKTIYEYIKKFGFSQKTGVELLGESPGLIRPLSQWTPVDAATVCFGQGIGVTALQLAMAYSAIANGGLLMKPLLVKRIVDAKGKVKREFEPQVKRRVISSETSLQIRKILRKVVVKGTGELAEIPGFAVAGKTGTSQKINPKTGRYYRDKYIASFIGFFPASHPRVVIAIVIDEPHPIHYGGVVAAPAFKEIAQHIIWQWQLEPTEPTKIKMAKVNYLSQKSLESGDEEKQFVFDHSVLQNKGVMPDLRGLPLRLALRILQKMKLQVKIEGTGRVFQQSPAPGAKIDANTECFLRLGEN